MLDAIRAYIRARRRARRSGKAHKVDCAPTVTGRVVVETRNPGDDWLVIEDDNNLVVSQAEGLMAHALMGTAGFNINYIELGDQVSPTPPDLADTDLENTTGQNKAVTKTLTGSSTAKFQATWLTSEGNGFTYTEMGLYMGTLGLGTMFARKLFDNPVMKTIGFEMRITWYITSRVQDTGSGCAGVSFVGPSSMAKQVVYDSPAGGEASIAFDYDFTPGTGLLDVYLNGLKLIGWETGAANPKYRESATLNAPVGGTPTNKGINLLGFTAKAGDRFELKLVALQ